MRKFTGKVSPWIVWCDPFVLSEESIKEAEEFLFNNHYEFGKKSLEELEEFEIIHDPSDSEGFMSYLKNKSLNGGIFDFMMKTLKTSETNHVFPTIYETPLTPQRKEIIDNMIGSLKAFFLLASKIDIDITNRLEKISSNSIHFFNASMFNKLRIIVKDIDESAGFIVNNSLDIFIKEDDNPFRMCFTTFHELIHLIGYHEMGFQKKNDGRIRYLTFRSGLKKN